jgi:murein DD-endopeptidase MepM/ murein hydrolase activator NlpD
MGFFGKNGIFGKNKTFIVISGDKIHSLRVNLFFQSSIVLFAILISVFLTYHITLYLTSQSNIQQKEHKIFLNEKINRNLSSNLNLVIQEIEEINKSLSSLGLDGNNKKKIDRTQKTEISSKIDNEKDLESANLVIRNTITNLDIAVDQNIKAINSALKQVGIDDVLKFKKVLNYNLYKDSNFISKNINYSAKEIASNTLSELKYKLEYVKLMQDFISTLPTAMPLRGQKITSKYGVRSHPVLGKLSMHHGIDFKGLKRSPIQATANANVKFAGWSNSFGNVVILNHGNDIMSIYAHLDELKVKTGQKVKKSDIVGLQGSTGRSTGEHLHYEVRYKGKSINPVNFIELQKVTINN